MVVTRPAVISSIFSADSRAAPKRDPLPRNSARLKGSLPILANVPRCSWSKLRRDAAQLSQIAVASGCASNPRKRAANTRFVKLLVMTNPWSLVSSCNVMTDTRGSF